MISSNTYSGRRHGLVKPVVPTTDSL